MVGPVFRAPSVNVVAVEHVEAEVRQEDVEEDEEDEDVVEEDEEDVVVGPEQLVVKHCRL